MRKRPTQKQLAFYTLYKNFKQNPSRFVSIWEFVGLIHIDPLNCSFLRSFKCPTRVSDIFEENPRLLQRQIVIRDGTRYYEYRIVPTVEPEFVEEESLKEFYKLIKLYELEKEIKKEI